ncbi:hypothetical protein [Streptomyces sp. NPDC096324]|uniref:hypothetical protein n=1 Tax=Streptomyces sp. NPDC096324 TaxID=3366085 RepID=UPI0037FFA446
MQSTATRVPARSAITTERLLTAPLPQLLADAGATLVESSITEHGFTGYAHQEGGRLLLAMRRGQPAFERDCVARALLGDVLGVPLPELPAPYQLTPLAGA